MELFNEIHELCTNIIKKNPKNFSGIGLVVYNSKELDPNCHCDLRPSLICPHYKVGDSRLIDYLIKISDYHHTMHDGFHMMNENGELTYVAQYFVPPIVPGISPNQEHGVRVYSSLCGSTLTGVEFIAVICSNKKNYIMKDGEAVVLS